MLAFGANRTRLPPTANSSPTNTARTGRPGSTTCSTPSAAGGRVSIRTACRRSPSASLNEVRVVLQSSAVAPERLTWKVTSPDTGGVEPGAAAAAADQSPTPTALAAATRTRYSSPLRRPVTTVAVVTTTCCRSASNASATVRHCTT